MPTASPTPPTAGRPVPEAPRQDDPERVSDRLETFTAGPDTTLGDLISTFEEKSFAILFIVLLGVSALPIPTGGATHVFDVLTVIVAAQLVVGRETIWIPRRWHGLQLAGPRQQKFLRVLLRGIRFAERFSKPRLRHLLELRVVTIAFGLGVIGLTAAAFLAPPFSGLDTLPALGVVLLALGILLEDAALVILGAVVGLGGVVVEVTVGQQAFHALKHLL